MVECLHEAGTAPITKNGLRNLHKGETPIEKNVLVVDEQGNEYEATWPKRAKGLVKSGRARFIDENTICLACPPNLNLEDNTMTDNKLTVNYLLEQIEKIANDTEYLYKAIEALSGMQNAGVPGDMGVHAKAEALAKVVQCRETTNQQLLSTYTQMYLTLTGS